MAPFWLLVPFWFLDASDLQLFVLQDGDRLFKGGRGHDRGHGNGRQDSKSPTTENGDDQGHRGRMDGDAVGKRIHKRLLYVYR